MPENLPEQGDTFGCAQFRLYEILDKMDSL
ncbi:hypothetical protein SDC9_100795 [bioreactor metagenome]|uniref:Uncharacterized protein n=1 Tax=bioreactor metagenome TaxID=1076179 RepID=A0A645AT29_9ZZZZ